MRWSHQKVSDGSEMQYGHSSYAYVPQLFALLHVNSHGEIDFEIMETYIEIQEKLAVKDVIEWGSNFR